MKAPKTPISFRLNDVTKQELKSLANRYDVTQAQIITVLVHLFHVHEEVQLPDAEALFNGMSMG